MAAKPPKPPGNFLKSLLNQHCNNKIQEIQQVQQQNNEHYNNKDNSSQQHSATATNSKIPTHHVDSNTTTSIDATKKNICNCSNISIMHLFHEMKQEFPTLPDTIVTQRVNENCHQREHCIQMLKHELELNPIPAQSYPAKVLHPTNNNNNNFQNPINYNNTTATTGTTLTSNKPPLQQKPLVVQQKPPFKPIKPTRTAPLQPPNQLQSNSNKNNANINSILNKNTSIPANKLLIAGGEDLGSNEVFSGDSAVGLAESNHTPTQITPPQNKQSQLLSTTTANSTSFREVCNGDKFCESVSDESTEKNSPRQRPTTLNLNTQLQKQQQLQRQLLNIQLQQRFQEQRNRQQHQLQLPHAPATIIKPLRKAPLPPIAPKPVPFQPNHTNANAVSSSDSLATNNTTTSPISESEISVSVSLSTPSPTSSSPNTTTHHPFGKLTPTITQHLQTKSPIRHRSVITLQPEPPYTRDFLLTPSSLPYAPSTASPSLAGPTTTATKHPTAANSPASATSSPTASATGSQKSFTSVNLTLRPPVSPNSQNSALQPSTIDITAGPGFSGASGGGNSLHYSSTSYDARLGYQQNFQITVTDECGVFTASRIRPQQQQHQRSLNQVNIANKSQYDNKSDKESVLNNNNYINSLLNAQQQQQFHNNNVVAAQQNIQQSIQSPDTGGSGGTAATYFSDSMCVPPHEPMDAPTEEILQRQKKKRDKLAAALREYKKRLGNVEQEINLLTGTIPTEGLSERLDEEISKLRRNCQDMLRSSNTFAPPSSQQELAINYQPQQQMFQQPEAQPFPLQRIARPPRQTPPRQSSLDIIQHHSQIQTPHAPPAISLPNLNMQNSLQRTHTSLPAPLPQYYHQQSAPTSCNLNNNSELYVDHNNHNETDVVVDDDADDYAEYDEMVAAWECNMCTFRNHPQLNTCEACENVRITPGGLTNLNYSALSTTNCTNPMVARTNSPVLGLLRSSTPNNAINQSNSSSRNNINAVNENLEHDTNLVQQQLQHFALHT